MLQRFRHTLLQATNGLVVSEKYREDDMERTGDRIAWKFCRWKYTRAMGRLLNHLIIL